MNPESSHNHFNQLEQQLAANQPATVLVERSNGDITPAQIMYPGSENTRVFFGNLNAEADDRAIPTKIVASEKLSDAHQEMLAEKLAGVALRSVEVAPIEEPSVDELLLERGIREAQAEKRRAQQEGRGDDSIYWGQVAGQYSKELRQLRTK